ncbi:MAG: NAD(P)/FAD-dependent oxidoreductase [Theionarchaea archaeon]|nr:NAD(P)/FAD-dependent oxidoreductase [Theionarchaea archaeon]
MTKDSYDLIIVGCGMAGAAAGLTALKEDLTVCIIERKKSEFVGRKICGELAPLKMVKWLEKEFSISLDYYSLKGLEICTLSGYVDSTQGVARVRDPLCTIDRWQFGQVMMKELLRRGAEFCHEVVTGPAWRNGVHGVKTHGRSYYGTLTVDCSGVFSALSRGLWQGLGSSSSIGLGYKENVILEEPIPKEYAAIIFDNSIVPSGYFWFFPKGKCELNVGAGGMALHCAPFRKAVNQVLKSYPCFRVKEKNSTGYGALPLGAPLSSMVAPGLLVCGDAAGQANPLTGEGIAPSLNAGHMAVTTAVEAIRRKDVSVAALWKYNYDFMQKFGRIFGSLLPLRDFMVSLSVKELKLLLQNVITDEVLYELEENEPSYTLKTILTTAANAARNPSLLFKLGRAVGRMSILRAIYDRYPKDPRRFPQWRQHAAAWGGL